MEFNRVYEVRLRFARYYVDRVCHACADYLSGFDASLDAIALFNADRVQIEQSAAWLMQSLDDNDEVARLFVRMLRDGYHLLHACLPNKELVTWLEAALFAATRLGDVLAQGTHLYALAWSAAQDQDFDREVALFEQAFVLARRARNEALQAAILAGLGHAYIRNGHDARAKPIFAEVYQLRLRLNDALGIHTYLYEQANMLFREGRWDEALPVYQQAYEYALKGGGYREIARVLTNIGIVYNAQGHYHDAIQVYEQALEFAQRIHFPPVVVFVLHALAISYVALQDYRAARDSYLEALRVAQRHQLHTNIAELQADLGNLAYQQGSFDEALSYLDTAIAYHRCVQADHRLIIDLGYLTLVYSAIGDFAAAKQTLMEHIEIVTRLSVELWKVNLVFIALQYNVSAALAAQISENESVVLLQAASQWAGFLLAHPGIGRDKVNVIRQLYPQIEARLGAGQVAALIEHGQRLTLTETIESVRSVIAAWNGSN